MPDQSPILGLPYILPAQAQKHVTHNTALQQLDALVQTSALSRSLATPPASPAAGDRYIVAAGATADWAGQENTLTHWSGSVWEFVTPAAGWRAHVLDENATLVFSGSNWDRAALDLQNLDGVGINTVSDSTNKLAVASDATLLTHAGSNHQLKINKAASANTASLLYQDGYSGRAEIGLTGDDDLHVKVSPDGSSWQEALSIDKTTGAVRFLESSGITAPNLIRNPSFHVAQRGDGPFTSAGYTVDGYEISVGVASPSITREKSSAIDAQTVKGEYFLRYDNTGQTGLYQSIKLRIEDLSRLSGNDLVISFDARCDSNQTLARIYAYQEFGSGGSTHLYHHFANSLAITTGWQRFTATANMTSIAGKTLGAGHHLAVYICLSLATPSLEGAFDIRRIKLETGNVPTPFLPSDPADDLARSRYYFQRRSTAQDINDLSYEMRVTPTASGAGPYDYSAEL